MCLEEWGPWACNGSTESAAQDPPEQRHGGGRNLQLLRMWGGLVEYPQEESTVQLMVLLKKMALHAGLSFLGDGERNLL